MNMELFSYVIRNHDDIPERYVRNVEQYPVKMVTPTGETYEVCDVVWNETQQTFYIKGR